MSEREPDSLAELRHRQKLTQAELGVKVLQDSGKPDPSSAYGQKTASLWERGETRPTPEQIRALAAALKTTEEKIRSVLPKEPTSPAVDLFNKLGELANEGTSCLVLACFGSPPKATTDSATFSAVAAAIGAGVAFALVVPYPRSLSTEPSSPNPTRELLEVYYRAVRAEVQGYCKHLQERANGTNAADKVAVFVPREDSSVAPLLPLYAPQHTRTVLVVKYSNDRYETELYAWTKLREFDGLRRAADEPDDSTLTQMKVWESYFREIIDLWRSSGHRTLSNTVSVEWNDWRFLSIAKTLTKVNS